MTPEKEQLRNNMLTRSLNDAYQNNCAHLLANHSALALRLLTNKHRDINMEIAFAN